MSWWTTKEFKLDPIPKASNSVAHALLVRIYIPSGTHVVRRIIFKFISSNRFSAGRTFLSSELDFAGRLITKPNLVRSRVRIKSYIDLFVLPLELSS